MQKTLTALSRQKQPSVVFYKKICSKSFAKSTGKHLRQDSFLIKFQAWGLELYWERDSGLGFFQWILWNFKNTFLEKQNTSGRLLLSRWLISQKGFIVDVRLGSKYAFYMQWKTIDRLLFDTNFYRKVFFKQASENWILISIIPRNIFKHHAKKIYNKYDKICIWKKSVLKLSSWKEILSWMIQQKHFLICPGL